MLINSSERQYEVEKNTLKRRGIMAKQRVLNVGIDLGTSRSVIACDNGVRTFISSYIGFPRDDVSKKMIKKDIVFGDEALKNKMALDLYRPVEKGVLKYSDSPEKNKEGYDKSIYLARELVKHLIELATEGEKGDFIVRGVIGTPALASQKNKKALIEIAQGILESVMIVSEPFSVAYGLNLLHNTLVIDIGAGTVDLCRMHGTIPSDEDQITTFKGGDYIDNVFFNLLTEKYKDANFTVNMVKRFKEENAFVTEQGERVYVDLPVKGKPTRHDVTDGLRTACQAIVPDIVEGISKLVATFDPEFQDELKENVILAGGGSEILGLRKEVEDHMKKNLGYGRVVKVEEPVYAGANGALILCKEMPDEYWLEIKEQDDKAVETSGMKEQKSFQETPVAQGN